MPACAVAGACRPRRRLSDGSDHLGVGCDGLGLCDGCDHPSLLCDGSDHNSFLCVGLGLCGFIRGFCTGDRDHDGATDFVV